MVCEKLKFEITVYFVTNINKHKDRGAFDLQNIKIVGQSFYILTTFIL